MLCSIGVFNASLMNDAIFKFKRYEDSSLSYTGVDKHEGKDVGGWDTVIKKEEYEKLFYNQQSTMEAPAISEPVEEIIEAYDFEESADTIIIDDRPQNGYVTGKYGIKPTVSMVAEPKPTPYSATPKKEENKPEINIDLSVVKEGAKVTHQKFGEGIIENIDKAQKYIRVQFAVGERTFIFPDAFVNGYLKI